MVYSQKDIYNAIDEHLQQENESGDIFVNMNDAPALIEAKSSILSRLIPQDSGYASLFLLESEFTQKQNGWNFH